MAEEGTTGGQTAGICARCGSNLESEANFCPSCGASVTGQRAVATGPTPEYMGFWIRFAGSLVDGVVLNVVVTLVSVAVITPVAVGLTPDDFTGDEEALFAAIGVSFYLWILILVLIPIIYSVVMTSVWGQTLGKMATGIKVVDGVGQTQTSGGWYCGKQLGSSFQCCRCISGFFGRVGIPARGRGMTTSPEPMWLGKARFGRYVKH